MNRKRKALKRIIGLTAIASTIPNIWTKPFVNTLVLPAHAMTSICSSVNVVGEWQLEVLDLADPIIRTINFLENGTTNSPFIHEWSVAEDGSFIMTQDISDWIFRGTFDSSCRLLSGTYTNNNIDNSTTTTGVWNATKV